LIAYAADDIAEVFKSERLETTAYKARKVSVTDALK